MRKMLEPPFAIDHSDPHHADADQTRVEEVAVRGYREEIHTVSNPGDVALASVFQEIDGYRFGYMEFDGGSAQWVSEHKIRTDKGSWILGTPHAIDGVEQRNWCLNTLLPTVLSAAQEAVELGKKVVFLFEWRAVMEDVEKAIQAGKRVIFFAEGGINGGGDFNANEQHIVAQALKERFGDQIIQDTWDDETVRINDPMSEEADRANKNSIDRNAPAVRKLISYYGDAALVEAALAMAMFTQDRQCQYILSDEAKRLLKSKDMDPKDWDSMQKMWDDSLMSDVAQKYAQIRDINLVRKVRKAENDGMVAIAIPGAQHVYQLKNVRF